MKKQLEEYNNLKNILLDKLYKVIDGELKDKDKVQRIKKRNKTFCWRICWNNVRGKWRIYTNTLYNWI